MKLKKEGDVGLPASGSAVLSPAERLLQQDVKLKPPGSENDVVQELQTDTLPQRTVSPAQSFVHVPLPAPHELKNPRGDSIKNQSSESTRDTNSWEKTTFSQMPPDVPPAWNGREVKVLSAFAYQEQAPSIAEGVKLLQGHQKVQETLADVSGWDMDKSHRWTQDAQRLLFDISQGKFDMVWITLPTQGMSRTLFANANGPSPQRSRRYPYGFPWLPQQGKRATDAVTIHAATLLVLAFAAMTQKGTALVLTTSEERGEAHFGEPCSWWQTAEVRYLAKLGATRGAFYTCELAHKWSQGAIDKPGSLGFMANFPCSEAVKTGWPQLSAQREYLGPLPQTCQCTHRHAALHQSRATSKSTHAAVCAEFLQALPRLPEGKGSLNTMKERGNHEYLFSPLADADSPASFLMKFQPWLQATFASLRKEKVEDVQEVAVASDELVGSGKGGKDEKVKRGRDGEGREGSGGTTQNRKCRRMLVSRELEMGGAPNTQEEKGSREAGRRGSALAVSADFGDLGGKCKTAHLLQLEKCGTARALEPVRAERSSNLSECESAPAPQPENFNGSSSEGDEEQLEERLQCYSELLRSQPSRACVREVKKLQYRHLYIGRGASHLGCGKSLWSNPFRVKRFGLEGAISKYEAMLRSTPNLLRQLNQLSDKVLLCHCETSEPCHGDVLIKYGKKGSLTKRRTARREKQRKLKNSSELPDCERRWKNPNRNPRTNRGKNLEAQDGEAKAHL